MDTDTTPTDPATLERVEKETLSRIHALRQRLFTQLVSMELAVLQACSLARQGHLGAAREQASQAAELAYAIAETTSPLDALVALLGGDQ